MIRNNIISYYIIVLFLPAASLAAVYDPILEQATPGTVTIIGESHKRVESVDMFRSLVVAVAGHHQCVVVGLEIASDQQPILDAVMRGRASVNEIALWPPIDHPPYRRMLEDFAAFKRQGLCIEVVAIDAGMNNEVGRDQWMALRLAEQVGDAPVLVLLGALHTIQKITWSPASEGHPPFVAQRLRDQGYPVKSYPQRWPESGNCGDGQPRTGRYYPADRQEALAILNESLLSLIRTQPPETAAEVVNGVVVWECVKREQSYATQ